MTGTLLCGINDSEGGHRALELSLDLADRLDLRLVVAHIAEVTVRFGTKLESVDELAWRDRRGAERRLDAMLRSRGVHDTIERRVAVGDVAGRLAQIASEDAAELIVVGAERRGRTRRRIENSVADQLDSETSIPVLVALPRVRAGGARIGTAAQD
jgi:nucleotide-binding universal stress UspA family protein